MIEKRQGKTNHTDINEKKAKEQANEQHKLDTQKMKNIKYANYNNKLAKDKLSASGSPITKEHEKNYKCKPDQSCSSHPFSYKY